MVGLLAVALVRCLILVPIARNNSRGFHADECWRWLESQLLNLGGGFHAADNVRGAWLDDEGRAVYEHSRPYTCAIPPDRLDEFRKLARNAGDKFDQNCIYIEIGQRAELLPATCKMTEPAAVGVAIADDLAAELDELPPLSDKIPQ